MMSNEKCGSKIHVFVINNVNSIEKEKKDIDKEENKKEIEKNIEVNDDENKSDDTINSNENNLNRKKEEIITHKIYYPQVKIVKVSCGKSIIGFLSIVGKIYCWHLNNFNDFDKNVPYLLVDNLLKNKTIHDVSSGYHHIAFISKDGELFTYGDNTYGQLGNNIINKDDYIEDVDKEKCSNINNYKIKNKKKYKVYKVDVQNDIVKCVYCSEKYTLYLTIDGLLYGFGLINEHFIKGKMNKNKIGKILTKPHHIHTNNIAFKKISIGINFILAINFNNFIYSWGENNNGVLGHSNCIDSYEPKKIENLINVIFISAGKVSLCKTIDEEIYIWGGNYGNKPNLIKNKFDDMHINNNFIIGLCGKKNIWVKNIDNFSHGYYINNLKINLLCSYDNLIIGVENYEEENDLNGKTSIIQHKSKQNCNNLNTPVGITENGVNIRNNPIDIVNNYISLSNENNNSNNINNNMNNNNINNNNNNSNNGNDKNNNNNNNNNNSSNDNNNNSNNNNNNNNSINDLSENNKRAMNDNLNMNDGKHHAYKDSININDLNCIKNNIVLSNANINEYNDECNNTNDNKGEKIFNENNKDIYNIENNKKLESEYDSAYKGVFCDTETDFFNEKKDSKLPINNSEWEKKNMKNFLLNDNFNRNSKRIPLKEELNRNGELNMQYPSIINNSDLSEEKKKIYIKEMGKDITNINCVNNIQSNNNNKNDLNNSSLECIDNKKYSTNYDTTCKESIAMERKSNQNNKIYANCSYEINEDQNKKENENSYLRNVESNIKNDYYNEIEINDKYMESLEDNLRDNYERKHEMEMEDEYYDDEYEDDNNFYDENDFNSLSHRNIIIINKKVTEKDQFNLKSSLKKCSSSEGIKKSVSFSNYVYDLAKNNYELINLNSNDEVSLSEAEKENRKFSYDYDINEFSNNCHYKIHNSSDEDKTIFNINKNQSNLKERVDEGKISLNDFQNNPIKDPIFTDKLNDGTSFQERTNEYIKEHKLCSKNINIVEKDLIGHKHDLLNDISTDPEENYPSYKDKLEGEKENKSTGTHRKVGNIDNLVSNNSNEFLDLCNLKDNDKGTINKLSNERLKSECVHNNDKSKYKMADQEKEHDLEYIKENNNSYLNTEETHMVDINLDKNITKIEKNDNIYSESCITTDTKSLLKECQKSSIYNYRDSSSYECHKNDNINKNYTNNKISDTKKNANNSYNVDVLSGVECPDNIPSYPMNKKENIHFLNNKKYYNCKTENSHLNINSNNNIKKGLDEFNFFCNNNNSFDNDFAHNSINCVNIEEKEKENLKKNEKECDEINNKKRSNDDTMNMKLCNKELNNEKQHNDRNNEKYYNEGNFENYFSEVHKENEHGKMGIYENTYCKDTNEEIKYVEERKKIKNNVKKKSNNILTSKVNATKISKLKSKIVNTVDANDSNSYVSHENNKMKLVKNNKKDVNEYRDKNKSDYFEYIFLRKLKRNLKKNKECNYYEMRKIKNVLGFINNEVINMNKKLKLKSTINKKMKNNINKMQNFCKILKKNDKDSKLDKAAIIAKEKNRKYLKKEISNLSCKSRQIKYNSGKINKSKLTFNENKTFITTATTTNNNNSNILQHLEGEIYNKQEDNEKEFKNTNINRNALISKKKETLTLDHNKEKKIKALLAMDNKSDNNNGIIKQNNLKRNLSEGNITKLRASNIGKKRSLSNKERIMNNKNMANDTKKYICVKNDKNKSEKKKNDYQNKQMFMSCLSVNTLNKNYVDCNNKNECSEKKIVSNIKRNVSACNISDISNNKNYFLNNYSKLKKSDYFSDSDKIPNTSIYSNSYKSNNISNYDYRNLYDAYSSCNDILEMEKQKFRINPLSFQEVKNLKKDELTISSISNIASKEGKSASSTYTSNNNIKICTHEDISNEENANKSNQNFHMNYSEDTFNVYGGKFKAFNSVKLKNKDNNEYNKVQYDNYDKEYSSECDDEKYEMNHICNRLLKKKRKKLLNEKKLKQLKDITENNTTDHSMKLDKENNLKKDNNNLYDNKFKTYEVHKNNEKYPINRNSSINNKKKSSDIKKVSKKGNEALYIYDVNRSKQNIFFNRMPQKKYILSSNNNNNKEKNFENSIIQSKEYNKNEKFGNNDKMKKIENKKCNENENKIVGKVLLDKKKNNKSILLKKLQNKISCMKDDIINEKIKEKKNLKIHDKNSDYSDNINYNETKNIMNIPNNESENANDESCKYYLLNVKEKLKNNLKKRRHKKYVNKIYKTMKYIFNEYNAMKKEKEDANKRNDYLKFLLESTVAKTNEMLRINKNSFQLYIDKMQKENLILKNELDEESYQHHYDLQQLVNKLTNMEKIKDYIICQNEEYNKKIVILAVEYDKLEKKKNELHKIVDKYKLNLEKEKKKKKYILRKIEDSLRVWETDYNELKEKYNSIKNNNDELIKNNEELKQETLKLKEELYNKDVIINKKIEKINNLNMNYVSLKNDYKNNVSDNMYTNKTYDDLLSKYEIMEEFFKKNTEKLEKELLEKEKQIQTFEKEKKDIQDKYLDISKNVTTLKNKLKNLKNYKCNGSSLEIFLESSIDIIFKNLDNVEELKVNENLKNKIINNIKSFMTNENFLKMYNSHNSNLNINSNVNSNNIDNSTTNYINNESDIESNNNVKNLNEKNLNIFNIQNKFMKNKKIKKTVVEEMKQILYLLEKKKNYKYEEKIDELQSEKYVDDTVELLKNNTINNKNTITKKAHERTPSESNGIIDEKKKKKKKNNINHKEKVFNYDNEQVTYLRNKINELTELNKKNKIKIIDEKIHKIKENFENNWQIIGICEDEDTEKKKDDDNNKSEINKELNKINNKPTFQNSKKRYIKTKIKNLQKNNINELLENYSKNNTIVGNTINDLLDRNTQGEKYNDFKNNIIKSTHKENEDNKNISKKNAQLKEIISNDFSSLQNEVLTNKKEHLGRMAKINDMVQEKSINNDMKILLNGTKKINSNNLKGQGVNKNSKKKKSFNAILDKIFDTPIDHSSINENMLNIQNLIESNIKNIFNTQDY
ncbi:regulator of chromosome condensation, putative [Plasmodium relictum]|uniref:Regulator of chromosome condensation, putative n=1 Tax=Plasmodium relictum TaxID=85471 RepID=A0A1J1H4B4_PLARL|nr:regulator of chromosome condensation, putative [Plasmodium relictum]CRG99409.1 regulator of chromosome condensation, putative [Plasmodium relictum]